jgi:hypothetical protein
MCGKFVRRVERTPVEWSATPPPGREARHVKFSARFKDFPAWPRRLPPQDERRWGFLLRPTRVRTPDARDLS